MAKTTSTTNSANQKTDKETLAELKAQVETLTKARNEDKAKVEALSKELTGLKETFLPYDSTVSFESEQFEKLLEAIEKLETPPSPAPAPAPVIKSQLSNKDLIKALSLDPDWQPTNAGTSFSNQP